MPTTCRRRSLQKIKRRTLTRTPKRSSFNEGSNLGFLSRKETLTLRFWSQWSDPSCQHDIIVYVIRTL